MNGDDEEPSDPTSEHFALVGRFIYGCTDIESRLAEVMRQVVGIDDEEIARAVIGIGDLKVSDYIEVIKRACTIRGIDNQELKTLLLWASYFNAVRGVIAHKPFLILSGRMAFSNYHTAKSIKKVWVYHCSTEQMNSACEFMEKVVMGLVILDLSKEAKNTVTPPRYAVRDEPNAASLEKLGLPARPEDIFQKKQK